MPIRFAEAMWARAHFSKTQCRRRACLNARTDARRYTRWMYSEAVLEHFRNPRNAGDLPDATATVEVTNPVCGDILRLAVRVEGGRITEARFKTQGCVTAIACSSFLTEMLCGKSLEEARSIGYQQISEALGGLPPATVHGSQLACDALEAILAKIA
jgi:nitrogen fixation protein NifU and related proteins